MRLEPSHGESNDHSRVKDRLLSLFLKLVAFGRSDKSSDILLEDDDRRVAGPGRATSAGMVKPQPRSIRTDDARSVIDFPPYQAARANFDCRGLPESYMDMDRGTPRGV